MKKILFKKLLFDCLKFFLISLFGIAIGTSLPELATSVMAAKKKKPDLVIGNIIGSNIFNLLLILGISSIIKPIAVNPLFITEFGLLLLSSLLLVAMMFTFKKHKIDRQEAVFLLLIYIGYIAFIFYRG